MQLYDLLTISKIRITGKIGVIDNHPKVNDQVAFAQQLEGMCLCFITGTAVVYKGAVKAGMIGGNGGARQKCRENRYIQLQGEMFERFCGTEALHFDTARMTGRFALRNRVAMASCNCCCSDKGITAGR